jgi:hypothetical protein
MNRFLTKLLNFDWSAKWRGAFRLILTGSETTIHLVVSEVWNTEERMGCLPFVHFLQTAYYNRKSVDRTGNSQICSESPVQLRWCLHIVRRHNFMQLIVLGSEVRFVVPSSALYFCLYSEIHFSLNRASLWQGKLTCICYLHSSYATCACSNTADV